MGELEFTVVVPCWQLERVVLAAAVVAAAVAVAQMTLLAAMGMGTCSSV
jgi:hypothetical protein